MIHVGTGSRMQFLFGVLLISWVMYSESICLKAPSMEVQLVELSKSGYGADDVAERTASIFSEKALRNESAVSSLEAGSELSLQTQGIGVMYSDATRTRPAQWVCTQTGWKPKSRISVPVQVQRWFQCTVRLLNLWWNSLTLDQTLTLKVIPHLRSTDVLVWETPSWASWMQSGGSRSLACKQSFVYIHPLFCPSYYMARRHGRYVGRTVTGSNLSIWCRSAESSASDGSNMWLTPPFRRQQADELTTHHSWPTSRPVRPRLSSAPGNSCSASPATVHRHL